MAIVVELVAIALLVLVNGVLAMSELAVVSARKARLQEAANHGSASAQAALVLANAPTRFLSTVQVGITLVGVLAGAFGGATLAKNLGDAVANISWLAPYSDAIGLGIVVSLITYLSLVVGELVPKQIALRNPERVAILVARPMQGLAWVASPVVRLLSRSTNLLLRALRLPPRNDPPVTEEEIRLLMAEGAEAGVFKLDEQDMVESVFRLDDRRVSALMTPHTEMAWINSEDDAEDIVRLLETTPHAYYPVCEGAIDKPLGIVQAKTLLLIRLKGEPFDLPRQVRPVRFVPENASASRLLDIFRHGGDHAALVIDEYGGIQGLITKHDLLEAIVGDMPAVEDGEQPDAVQRQDGSWLLDGLMPVDDVKDLLAIDCLPGDEQGEYETLAGFVMSRLGAIPRTGELVRWAGWRFEVVDMDGRRVDKILVEVDSEPAAEDSPGC